MSSLTLNQLSDNVWYAVTETRVNWTSTLQYDKNALVFNNEGTTALENWQFLSLNNGHYNIRNNASAVSSRLQLATCYRNSENSTSKTQACMLNATADPSQEWTLDSSWKDGTFRIRNVGNGTAYNLDVHKGTPVFLSNDTAASSDNPAQHWMLSSKADINDDRYSTVYARAVRRL